MRTRREGSKNPKLLWASHLGAPYNVAFSVSLLNPKMANGAISRSSRATDCGEAVVRLSHVTSCGNARSLAHLIMAKSAPKLTQQQLPRCRCCPLDGAELSSSNNDMPRFRRPTREWIGDRGPRQWLVKRHTFVRLEDSSRVAAGSQPHKQLFTGLAEQIFQA